MINGRTDVGDSQAHRLLAVLDLKASKTLWADASAFAGSEKPVKPGEAAKPRLVDWGLPECSDDGSRCVAAAPARWSPDVARCATWLDKASALLECPVASSRG